MKKDLNPSAIRQKFISLISMDQQAKQKLQRQNKEQAQKQAALKKGKQIIYKAVYQPQKDYSKDQFQNRFKQLIYTKSDIVKQISKLKPYLNQQKQQLTTVEVQNLQNKKMTAQQKRKLSNVVIYLNKRLCQKLRQQNTLQKQFSQSNNRIKRQKQGWIYQVFYRFNQNLKTQLSNQQWKNGYVVLTTYVEIYENLTFTDKKYKFNVSEMKRVKYTSEKQYQIIDIRFDGNMLQFGFLSDTKLELFDRMLFLLKNMARTSTNRLFQNQLIKSLYSEY